MSTVRHKVIEGAIIIALLYAMFVAGFMLGRNFERLRPLPTPAAEAGEENQSRIDGRSASSARRGSIPYLPAGSARGGAACSPLRVSNTGARVAPHAAAREQIPLRGEFACPVLWQGRAALSSAGATAAREQI